jgi:hypothetical protein
MLGVMRIGIHVFLPHWNDDDAHQQLLYRLVNVRVDSVTNHKAFNMANALPIWRVYTAHAPTDPQVGGLAFCGLSSRARAQACDRLAEIVWRSHTIVAARP